MMGEGGGSAEDCRSRGALEWLAKSHQKRHKGTCCRHLHQASRTDSDPIWLSKRHPESCAGDVPFKLAFPGRDISASAAVASSTMPVASTSKAVTSTSSTAASISRVAAGPSLALASTSTAVASMSVLEPGQAVGIASLPNKLLVSHSFRSTAG